MKHLPTKRSVINSSSITKRLSSKFVALSAALLLLFSPLNSAYGDEAHTWLSDWEEHDGDEEFTTQCRKHSSDIKQCIFTTQTDTPIAALANAVRDVSKFTEWAESVAVSKQVPKLELGEETVVYTEYTFSGAYDRFAVTRYDTEQFEEEQRIRVSFKTINTPSLNPDPGLIRFPLMAGYWDFTVLENGKTQIKHKSFTLPGGSIQKTLSYFYNIAYIDASYETIRNLIAFANSAPYADSQWKWKPNAHTDDNKNVAIANVADDNG